MNITYERIPLEKLKFSTYNRQVNQYEAKRIAAFYDPRLFGIIKVSENNGEYTIVDGQHRTVGAGILGLKDVMCEIIHGLPYTEAAMLFVQSNGSTNRKNLQTYDLVRGLYEAEDPTVRQMYGTAKAYGFFIANQVGQNKIPSVSAVMGIIKRESSGNLATTFHVLRDAWDGEKESLKGHMIEGVSLLLSKYSDKIDPARLSAKLKTASPSKILADADADGNGGQKRIRVARQMLKYYNKNLDPANKLKDIL